MIPAAQSAARLAAGFDSSRYRPYQSDYGIRMIGRSTSVVAGAGGRGSGCGTKFGRQPGFLYLPVDVV